MRELITVQERILDRALYLIGKRGNYSVPIRDITKAAKVNVNAINYYFGSKENLLGEVDKFFIQNYIDSYSVLDGNDPPTRRLLLWANEVMEYTLQYPGIQMLQRHALHASEPSKMKEFLLENAEQYDQKVVATMQEVFPMGDDFVQSVKIMFYSALIHPASFGTDVRFDTSVVNDREFRMHYIQFVIDTLKKGLDKHEI